MASITPTFIGSYSGQMINNMTNFAINNIDNYLESIDFTYRPAIDRLLTGFDDTLYLLNPNTASYVVAIVNITLVGDLPLHLMQQFTQLSKGVLGLGMNLTFVDDIATDRTYIGKWSNACDFVENGEIMGGGNVVIEAYNVYDT